MILRIDIRCDHAEYSNDLAEVARLFGLDVIPPTELETVVTDITAQISISQGESMLSAQTLLRDSVGEFSYEYANDIHADGALERKRYEKRFAKIALFRALKKRFPDTVLPWGSLTGIRPTRLLRELEGVHGENEARRMMLEEFEVSPDKYALAKTINSVQSPFIADTKAEDVSVYIGIPYCKTRCLYCSFLSGLRTKKTDMVGYIAALKRDIAHGAELMRSGGYRLRSVYMGGGTPTVLTAEELEDVLTWAIKEYGIMPAQHEITVEAGRPDTITREKLEVLRRLGVSRISVNPQTMNPRTLELIGRSHTVEEIEDCCRMAHEMGFIINMDMITCLPGETVADVENTLERIIALRPHNLTVHTLAIKRSSMLRQTIEQYPLPSAATAESMLEAARSEATAAGYLPYYMYRQKYMRGNLENVGYALPGFECVYNIDMMEETTSILAHGAGAMTKRVYTSTGSDIRLERIPHPKEVRVYIDKADRLEAEKEALFAVNTD